MLQTGDGTPLYDIWSRKVRILDLQYIRRFPFLRINPQSKERGLCLYPINSPISTSGLLGNQFTNQHLWSIGRSIHQSAPLVYWAINSPISTSGLLGDQFTNQHLWSIGLHRRLESLLEKLFQLPVKFNPMTIHTHQPSLHMLDLFGLVQHPYRTMTDQ